MDIFLVKHGVQVVIIASVFAAAAVGYVVLMAYRLPIIRSRADTAVKVVGVQLARLQLERDRLSFYERCVAQGVVPPGYSKPKGAPAEED